jgi:hypothetical protein
MARGQHHAEVGVQRAREVGHPRCRDHPEPVHVNTGAGKPRDDGRFKEVARGPRVTADDRDRAGGGAVSREHRNGRKGEIQRQPGCQIPPSDTTNTIGTKEPGHAALLSGSWPR